MTDRASLYRQAEGLRKSGQFADAEQILAAMWQERADPYVGWRLAFCLRKLGNIREALEIIRKTSEAFPDDEWVRREHAWCIYAHDLKPAHEQNDLNRTARAAQQMMDLVSDELSDRLAIFAVIDVAKARGKWGVVNDWCGALDPQQLSAEPGEIDGQKTMSDCERWYFAKVKALIHLEQWEGARPLALDGAAAFPRKEDFPRWAAQARAGSGDVAGTVEELEGLIRRSNAQWYVLADLARLRHRLDQDEEALRIGCKAALAFGEDKAKINLFTLLAEIGLAAGLPKFAAPNIGLARAVRLREGWPIHAELISLEQRVRKALGDQSPDLPLDAGALLRICQRLWHEQSIAGQQRYQGQVHSLPEGKKHGFISSDAGGRNVFVLLRDLPRAAQVVGARVAYGLEESYDKTRDQMSVRAVDVQLVR